MHSEEAFMYLKGHVPEGQFVRTHNFDPPDVKILRPLEQRYCLTKDEWQSKAFRHEVDL